MYPQRATRSSSARNLRSEDVNKPFKSPVIAKPEKEKPKKYVGLLDDIEDSDLDQDDDDDDSSLEEVPLVDLSRTPQKASTSTASKPRSEIVLPSTPETHEAIQTISRDDDDEIEEVEEVEEIKPSRRTTFSGKKGKFATRKERETSQYMEMRKTKRDETATTTDTNQKALKIPACAESLLKNLDKYDPIKIANESPKPSPKQDIIGRARYNLVLKSNGLDLDPRLQSLLDDKLDNEEHSFDFGSDSDSSMSSTSSKKRKRTASDSDTTPKTKTEKSKPAKQMKRTRSGPQIYLCPMCKEEVSKQLYESYLPDLEQKFKIELRRKFHRSHKLAAVHAKVKELNIPDIDWDNLEERCAKYFPYLSDIMAGKAPSHYRELSEKFNKTKRKNHKSRTEAIFDEGNWEKEYPGYYGPRGIEILGDAIGSSKMIMEALKKLKKAKDITTTGGGAGSYIQCILIPELATRLIMEDFGMADSDIAKGRKLMLDTIDIGRMLNDDGEEENDDMGVNDGMDWWWKEQETKRLQDEETEPSQSQSSACIELSDDE